MSFSIATQSGNFSYQASITPQRDNHVSFGFSFLNTGDGSIEDRIIFSGESGKLYDSENNFFYSYNSGEEISLSGNKVGNYNNYFVNNVLLNSYNYNGTGYVNNFTENGVDADISFIGVEPIVQVTGIFENDDLTGNLVVKNNSDVGISFNIFSGSFQALSNFFGFGSGQNTGIIEGQSSREFLVNQLTSNTTGSGVILPISFTSDFGKFTRSGLISFTRQYEYSLSLLGQDTLSSTGIFDYDLLFSEIYGQNYIDDPFGLHFTFGNVSGYSGYADFDTKTGRISGSVSGFETSNTIQGTGDLTGLIFNSGGTLVYSNILTESSDDLLQEDSSFILLESEGELQQGYLTLSGYSTGLGVNYVGVIPAPIYTGSTVFATGEMSYPFLVSASGIVTGSDISLLRDVSGGYNFTETGAIVFTGEHTQFTSFFTGVILSGNNTAGQPVVTEPNTVLCFSYDRQSIVADSDQTRDKDYSSVFSGFSTGSFIGQALFPSDQAGLDITTTISGSKISGSAGDFIGTGTGVFDVTGIFPMDTIEGGSYINDGYIIDLADSIITGVATGLLAEDPNSIGALFSGTGITGFEYTEGTGILTGSGIITGEVTSIATGFTGINFNYNYIAEGSILSGITTELTHDVTSNKYGLPDIPMSGEYEYRFDSVRLGNVFEEQFVIKGEDDVSGYVDFTGQFSHSGTGVFKHTQDVTGVGYTGVGIVGSISTPIKDIIFDGSSGITGRRLTNTGRLISDDISLNWDSYSIPVSSVYDRFSPFNISGHSGIALICDHTNETAPIFDFSSNDSARSSYINHPIWLKYNWLDNTDRADIRCGLSPRYFLSGTGMYKSRNSNSIAITVYSGSNLNDLSYREIDTMSTQNSTKFNQYFTSRYIGTTDQINTDFYFLLTRNTQSSEPSGFHYFYFEDSNIAQSAVSPQFNTFFDSSSADTAKYLTNYPSSTDISGYLLSSDTIYPTGSTTNRLATSVPGVFTINSGFNSFETGFTMTGYFENFEIQGTGMSGVSNINGTGQGTGILHALQDRNRFPNYSQENEIFTQMTGNFNGDKSVNNFEINTGVFSSNNIYFLRKRVDSFYYQEIDEYEVGSYQEITRFRIPTYQSSVEEISGIMKGHCDKIGYNVYFGTGKLGFTSYPQMTYPIGASLGLGTSSSSHLSSLSKDKKYATRQSGGLYTLIENGVEVSTQGTNLPYSGIMSGGVGFSFQSDFVTGTGIFEAPILGPIYATGYTGLQNTLAKYYIQSLDFDDNIVDYDFNATGSVPTTGLGTGRDPITVTAGNTSGTFATTALDMLPFTGIGLAPITISQPEGGVQNSYADGFVFSGLRTGYNFATGILTGSFDYTGLIDYSQYNSLKTGVKVGIGVISGDVAGIIYPGSGEFNFSGIKTGLPSFINSVVGEQGETILTSSGNVPITPFTGSLNQSYIGTGFYSENITPSNLGSLTYAFDIPNYRKTFTGEYEILTGINGTGFTECTGFLDVPSIDLTGYSGYVTLTGDDDLSIRIVKKKYFDDSQDINIIKYSGIGTLDLSYDNTGSLTFIG